MCLAFLYHRQYFCDNLVQTHKFFKTVLFTRGIATKLAPRVALTFPNDAMRCTGVPLVTHIMGELQTLKETVRGTLHQEFEQRQFDAGHVTRDVMETLMSSMTTKILAQIESVSTHRVPETVEVIGDQKSERFQRWTWGGQMHPVPEGFEVDTTLPSATLF